MNDREMLERAAKAAGIRLEWADYGDGVFRAPQHAAREAGRIWWNPLADDGDALRLAVKLGLQVTQYPIYEMPKHSVVVRPGIWNSDANMADDRHSAVEAYDGDPYAATRRAITRAAASLGAGDTEVT